MTTQFKDPFLQTLLHVYLDPLFKRFLHNDRYNVIPTFLLLFGLYSRTMSSCCLALMIYFIKRYLICGPIANVYPALRKHANSYLRRPDTSRRFAVATLYLNEDNAFANGVAYATIMHKEMGMLITQVKTFLKCVPVIKLPSQTDITTIYSNLPSEIQNEIKGMVYALIKLGSSITLHDLILIQLLPELQQMGCTCYVGKDDESDKLIFGRNMDWMSFSSAQYSIVISYKKHKFKSLALPGMVGCITAWNNNGIVMAMNVTNHSTIINFNKIPSILLNYDIMINIKHMISFNEVCDYIKERQHAPCIAYHLTLANSDRATRLSFYQDNGDIYEERMVDNNLITVNWTYPHNDHGRGASNHRNDLIKNQNKKGICHVIDMLTKVQTFETMHTIVFDFHKRNIFIGIDNGYSVDKLCIYNSE